ncbi:MAG: rhodanese-like domain-containing protein [Betaproteobacteria bacterium]
MSKNFRVWLLLLIASSPFMLLPVAAADTGRANLVTVQWLAQKLQRDDMLLLDASPGPLYAAKHISGAVNVDVFSFGGRESSIVEMQQRIQSWGVSAGKKIVIYDQGGTYMATSLLFDLYYHGVPLEGISVLDGGIAKWQAMGGAVTKEPTAAPKLGTFQITKLNEDVRAKLPEFLVASGDPVNNALVEALDPDQHFGAAKFFDRAGHIPNAIMAPAADFFNADKTFKSAEEIGRMLAYLGIKPEQQIYSHCGGGIAASVPFFAAKMMLGYPKVKLYKESQLEWLRDDRGLPFWTYDAPNMLREKTWLNGWGSPMLRTFGVAKLNVVDVRSEEAYHLGHVPFAVNIPADVFKRNIATPAKLVEVLSAAGVNATYEAVIVSDGGVNAGSAMAYLMLEKLGQKKISLLIDSVDDWGLGGFTLTKDATTVGPKKSPKDLAVPATTYPANVRPGLLTSNPVQKAGAYAKVFIASGKNMPVKALDGKVIHVPYTELVNPDGSPKAAKDIWSILVKAGLPRYAEIICYADEPGEAAANYFILKLLGYPDVKVLAS